MTDCSCRLCGRKVEKEMNFCPYCGARFTYNGALAEKRFNFGMKIVVAFTGFVMFLTGIWGTTTGILMSNNGILAFIGSIFGFGLVTFMLSMIVLSITLPPRETGKTEKSKLNRTYPDPRVMEAQIRSQTLRLQSSAPPVDLNQELDNARFSRDDQEARRKLAGG